MTVADIATLYLRIEQSIREDEAFADSLQRNYPSRLQTKLKELRDE